MKPNGLFDIKKLERKYWSRIWSKKHYFVQSSYDLSFDDLYFLQAQPFARIKCSCMDFIGVIFYIVTIDLHK